MKYMGNYYATRSTIDLKVLRSIKNTQAKKLEALPISYFNVKELMKLRTQIVWINAELTLREQQQKLPLE